MQANEIEALERQAREWHAEAAAAPKHLSGIYQRMGNALIELAQKKAAQISDRPADMSPNR